MNSNLDGGGGFALLAVYALRDFAPDCLWHILAPAHAFHEREREGETGVSVSREHVVRFWFVFVSDVRSCVRARVEVRLARTGARETSYSLLYYSLFTTDDTERTRKLFSHARVDD